MFTKILVPLDGSTFAEAALPAARALHRRGGAVVRLLAVHDSAPAFGYREWDETATEWAHRYLEGVTLDVFPGAGSAVTHAVRQGVVAPEIEKEAATWDADLLVMATHGRGAVSRFWLGSVADHVVRHGRRPVFLVRPSASIPPDPTADFDVARVVVPLDGSPLAERALEPAGDLARLFGAPVHLLRSVAFPVAPVSSYIPHTVELNRRAMEEARVTSERYLEGVVARLRKEGIEADAHTALEPSAAHAVVQAAGSDPVVMATHGRGGVGRALLGSVADKVIRAARGPVLVLRAEDARAGNAGVEDALAAAHGTPAEGDVR